MSERLLTINNARTLVLNADLRPLSYNPLSTWNWEEAVRSIYNDKSYVVEEYDLQIHSPSVTMNIPSVIALKEFVYVSATVRFSKYNIFSRDKFTCLYCGEKPGTNLLSFDHVIPKSKGGKTNWTNIATACISCNMRKNDRTPEVAGLRLLYKPYAPSHDQMRRLGRVKHENLEKTWLDYLYWSSELES